MFGSHFLNVKRTCHLNVLNFSVIFWQMRLKIAYCLGFLGLSETALEARSCSLPLGTTCFGFDFRRSFSRVKLNTPLRYKFMLTKCTYPNETPLKQIEIKRFIVFLLGCLSEYVDKLIMSN